MITPCFFYKSGDVVQLTHTLSKTEMENPLDSMLQRVLDVLSELAPLVQPITAELSLEYASSLEHPSQKTTKPDVTSFTLQEAPWPPIQRSSLSPGPALVSYASQINAAVVRAWFYQSIKPLDQWKDDPLIISHLRFPYTRVRVLNEAMCEGKNFFPVADGDSTYQFPIERGYDGLWVLAPVDSEPDVYDSGIELEFGCGPSIEWFEAVIRFHWSWWMDPETIEGQFMQAAFKSLISKDWGTLHVAQGFHLT